MNVRASLLQAAIAGLVGFAVAAWTMTDAREQERPRESAAATVRTSNAAPTSSYQPSPTVRVEHRLLAASEAGQVADTPAPSLEESIERVRAHAADRADAHASERVDGGWADATAQAVAAGLDPVAEAAGFDVIEIDCRTTTCKVALEWIDYDHAQLESDRLVDAVRAVSCGIDVPLIPPSDPGAAYGSAFYLSCARGES